MGNFDKYYFSPLFIKDEIKIEKRNEKLKDQKKEQADDQYWKTESTYRSHSEAMKEDLFIEDTSPTKTKVEDKKKKEDSEEENKE